MPGGPAFMRRRKISVREPKVRRLAMIRPECGPGLFNSAEHRQVLCPTGSHATTIHAHVVIAG
jgi:hypothetical protein